jgi:hypothetical protein
MSRPNTIGPFISAMKQIHEIRQRRYAPHHIHQKLRPGRLIQKQAMLNAEEG